MVINSDLLSFPGLSSLEAGSSIWGHGLIRKLGGPHDRQVESALASDEVSQQVLCQSLPQISHEELRLCCMASICHWVCGVSRFLGNLGISSLQVSCLKGRWGMAQKTEDLVSITVISQSTTTITNKQCSFQSFL